MTPREGDKPKLLFSLFSPSAGARHRKCAGERMEPLLSDRKSKGQPEGTTEPGGVHGGGGAWGDARKLLHERTEPSLRCRLKRTLMTGHWAAHMWERSDDLKNSTDRTDEGPTAHRRLTGTWG